MFNLLNTLVESNKKYGKEGKLAAYIPALLEANPNDLGIYIVDTRGKEYFAGDYNKKFTIQSISKVVSLILAIKDNGRENVFKKVDVEEILDLYFKQCSIELDARDLARFGVVIANDGVLPWNGRKVIPKDVCRIVKSIMVTCGMYDASGEFAVNVGIPAKSGVGGGIVAAVPRQYGIGIYGPALDEKGNSIAGLKLIKDLSDELDLSIF